MDYTNLCMSAGLGLEYVSWIDTILPWMIDHSNNIVTKVLIVDNVNPRGPDVVQSLEKAGFTERGARSVADWVKRQPDPECRSLSEWCKMHIDDVLHYGAGEFVGGPTGWGIMRRHMSGVDVVGVSSDMAWVREQIGLMREGTLYLGTGHFEAASIADKGAGPWDLVVSDLDDAIGHAQARVRAPALVVFRVENERPVATIDDGEAEARLSREHETNSTMSPIGVFLIGGAPWGGRRPPPWVIDETGRPVII